MFTKRVLSLGKKICASNGDAGTVNERAGGGGSDGAGVEEGVGKELEGVRRGWWEYHSNLTLRKQFETRCKQRDLRYSKSRSVSRDHSPSPIINSRKIGAVLSYGGNLE